tara:strand:+ start:1119 stop:1346 length:228 start_codon:yes stop_codon:yes gene_type:complete
MIKKGDLVIAADHEHKKPGFIGNAVVLTDAYASTFTNRDTSGKAVLTAEKLVVDLLAEGNRIYKKIPLELLSRVK